MWNCNLLDTKDSTVYEIENISLCPYETMVECISGADRYEIYIPPRLEKQYEVYFHDPVIVVLVPMIQFCLEYVTLSCMDV